MSLDLTLLGSKLARYREQFALSMAELAEATGIPEDRLASYEAGRREPSGDEVLILSDFYRCDYRFFISNERLASFEQTETLFRRFGDQLTKTDRWAIQEFLFLCESEQFLMDELGVRSTNFSFEKRGSFFKAHGEEAAEALRLHLRLGDREVSGNLFRDLRAIGIHVFRRQLVNSAISGLFIRHPVAGRCVLVNYREDIYRQRFTVAHEAGHAILDTDADVIVSFERWDSKDLSEIRANTFASRFLLPPTVLRSLPDPERWNVADAIDWATRLHVNVTTLVIGLEGLGRLSTAHGAVLKKARVPRAAKVDPELPNTLSDATRSRREELLRRGLTQAYVHLCFDAYQRGIVSAGRLADMLLTDQLELPALAALFSVRLAADD